MPVERKKKKNGEKRRGVRKRGSKGKVSLRKIMMAKSICSNVKATVESRCVGDIPFDRGATTPVPKEITLCKGKENTVSMVTVALNYPAHGKYT